MKFEGLITENEYEYIKKALGREPKDFELNLFSASYSEHCSYKHSKELLKFLPRKNAVFYEENAGGIELKEYAILFKMESHNHPCAVEPFNGAATGIGGIIRDILAMNARPIALCNSLKFGNNAQFSDKLIRGVVKGISVYGNSIGVPTVSTEVLFCDCFNENPLVNVCAIGLAKKSDILTSNKAKNGLKLMLIGSATMRDGLGGAAFASKELSDEKSQNKISIQIANPFMKKKLIEACLEIFSKKLVITCQDCGAAGILSSTSEIAYKSGCGVEIDLNKVHIGDKSIKDFEIMLSETQERMLFVVQEENISEIISILKKFELGYSIIGKTVQEKKYIIKNSDKRLADLPLELLLNPPETKINFKSEQTVSYSVSDGNHPDIYEQYDHSIGGRTCFQPVENPQFNSLWIYEENCYLGIYTFSVIIQENPFEEVYEAILTASKSLVKKGFSPVGITNCLNFANPEIPPTMYEFSKTILAIKKACEKLRIPVCSGNVSFYNESSSGKIKNTPSFTMLGLKAL
jgi:phosphoribosylformylglycinamidine synthase